MVPHRFRRSAVATAAAASMPARVDEPAAEAVGNPADYPALLSRPWLAPFTPLQNQTHHLYHWGQRQQGLYPSYCRGNEGNEPNYRTENRDSSENFVQNAQPVEFGEALVIVE